MQNTAHLKLQFSTNVSPALRVSEFKFSNNPTKIICLDHEQDGEWSPGMISLCLLFVEYILANGGEFVFVSSSQTDPVVTLAHAIDRPTWIKDVFGYEKADKHSTNPLFKTILKWENLKGRNKGSDERRIQVDAEILPPKNVKIFLGKKWVKPLSDLRMLATSLRKQFNEHPARKHVRKQNQAVRKATIEHASTPRPAVQASYSAPLLAAQNSPGGLPSFPFRALSKELPLFRGFAVSPRHALLPSWQEFVDGKVVPPSVVTAAANRLDSEGFVLISGFRACGKTTLASAMVANHQQGGKTAFYCDLADETILYACKEALTTIVRLSSPGTLFLLENIHAQPELAYDLWQQWKDSRNGSYCLMVGRLDTIPLRSRLHSLTENGLELVVLFETLVQIRNNVLKTMNVPFGGNVEHNTVAQWHDKYRNDLHKFVFDLSNKPQEFGWTDQSQQNTVPKRTFKSSRAIADFKGNSHLWNVYFAPLEPSERRDLATLVALSCSSISLPAELVTTGAFHRSRASGLVVQTDRCYRCFELHDQRFAPALAAIASKEYPMEELVMESARRHTFVATALAANFQRKGRWKNAVEMLALALQKETCFDDILSFGLQYARVIGKRFVRLGVLSWPQVDANFLRSRDLRVIVAQAPPALIIEFIVFARQQLPATHAKILEYFASNQGVEALMSNLCRYSVNDLLHVVAYLVNQHEPDVSRTILRSLEAPQVMEVLKGKLDQCSLGEIIGAYAGPAPLRELVVKLLGNASLRHEMLLRLWQQPIATLRSTLMDARHRLPESLWVALVGDISSGVGRQRLESSLVSAAPLELVRLRQFTAKHVPALSAVLFERCRLLSSVPLLDLSLEHWSTIIEETECGSITRSKLIKKATSSRGLPKALWRSRVNDLQMLLVFLHQREDCHVLLKRIMDVLSDHRKAPQLKKWLWNMPAHRAVGLIHFFRKKVVNARLACHLILAIGEAPIHILRRTIPEIPLGWLCVVLRFGERKCPELLQKNHRVMNDRGNAGLLRAKAAAAPLGDVTDLLKHCDRHNLNLLGDQIHRCLESVEHQRKLEDQVFITPPAHLLNFFAYSRERLHNAGTVVAAALGNPSNQSKLDELARNCWLGELTSFMRFAEKELPPIVSRTLGNILIDEERAAPLIERTRLVPTYHLRSSLRFLEKSAPEFHQRLTNELSQMA